VDVVGAYDEEHLIIKTDNGYGLVQNQFLRTEGTEPYETWTGYAYADTEVFSDVWFLTEPVRTLSRNEEVEVLEELNHGYLIRIEETEGFVSKDGISRAYLSSGWSGGSGSRSGGSTGADGGDISLGSLSTIVPQAGDVTGTGKVLVNDAQIILGWFDRDEAMEIVTEEGFAESKEGYYTVYLNGLYGYVLQAYVLKDGDAPFENWDGYAQRNAPVYDNYYLSGEPITKLSSNTEIQILLDLGNCYMVSYGDAVGYMAKDTVSDSYIHYSSGGTSGGGEWTPPAL
jgi:hypothetical protein